MFGAVKRISKKARWSILFCEELSGLEECSLHLWLEHLAAEPPHIIHLWGSQWLPQPHRVRALSGVGSTIFPVTYPAAN